MENFFASEPIPEGYKLIVEEDTGEWFMIMVQNDTFKKVNAQSEQVANFSYQPGNLK